MEEPKQIPPKPKDAPKQPDTAENVEKVDCVFSPGFKSVAAMAGWDEEALLIASLVVEDTPDRESKHKKRSNSQFRTPPTNSRRKRRAPRSSPISITVTVLNLDEDETPIEEGKNKSTESRINGNEKSKIDDDQTTAQGSDVSSSSSGIQCLDRLREELSCAICLEICFEPSTTPCGHSFCKKCLRFAADKCGKRCPKCRQLIGNGRSCTVNTVLWNTIQLLFPQEVEARKTSGAMTSGEGAKGNNHKATNPIGSESQSLERGSSHNLRNRSSRGEFSERRRRRGVASQDEDAALALRLQREEFMVAFRESDEEYRNAVPMARANLRAMASRAISIRLRGLST